ncbi:MAG: sugar ABC transporter permease [Oscillospiraceae bacterium]|nr:sugar ABC transporter permease [Oscillospiraceae bacterium]
MAENKNLEKIETEQEATDQEVATAAASETEYTAVIEKSLKKGKTVDLNRSMKKKGLLFLIPFFVGFVFFFFVIIADSLIFSFAENTLTPSGYHRQIHEDGLLVNYKFAFTGENAVQDVMRANSSIRGRLYTQILTTSVSNLFTNTPIIILFSLFVAVLLNQKMRGRVAFRAIFFIPVILATGLIDRVDEGNRIVMLLEQGMSESLDMGAGGIDTTSAMFNFQDIMRFMMSLNLPVQATDYVVTLINNVVTIVNQSGVQILIFLSGLQSIPDSIYESANVEGASGWECFWKITFPMISPMILVNLFYTIIDYFTRSSGPMMMYIEAVTLGTAKLGEPAAMAWIFFAIVSLILVVVALIINKFVFYQQKES